MHINSAVALAISESGPVVTTKLKGNRSNGLLTSLPWCRSERVKFRVVDPCKYHQTLKKKVSKLSGEYKRTATEAFGFLSLSSHNYELQFLHFCSAIFYWCTYVIFSPFPSIANSHLVPHMTRKIMDKEINIFGRPTGLFQSSDNTCYPYHVPAGGPQNSKLVSVLAARTRGITTFRHNPLAFCLFSEIDIPYRSDELNCSRLVGSPRRMIKNLMSRHLKINLWHCEMSSRVMIRKVVLSGVKHDPTMVRTRIV